ncbi:MAG TPA: DsbA family protein [Flavipsychrobacter sp.]|nr:DsbA family protein [Flavipsychrobacter sp.]
MIQTSTANKKADRLSIVYYTDPLCCWSWAMERHWLRFMEEYKDSISVRYCMTGLIESWQNYNDTVNCISKPIQMGPLWMQASHISGQKMASDIWVKDPPASSYLACMAVKCAFLQSDQAGIAYLRALREALMLDSVNIAKLSSLYTIARQAAKAGPLDADRLYEDIQNGKGKAAFTDDLKEVSYMNITRSPSLLASYGDKARMLCGFRPYEDLLDFFNEIHPLTELTVFK